MGGLLKYGKDAISLTTFITPHS